MFSTDIDVYLCRFEDEKIIYFESGRYFGQHYHSIGDKVCEIGSMKRRHDSTDGGDHKKEIFSDF